MKSKLFKRFFSVLLSLTIITGIIPVTIISAEGAAGESTSNPILISTMDQLIEEMEKDVTTPTYYKLTEDISHETSIETVLGNENNSGDDGFTTVRKPYMAQCVVGTGKKFLELDGHDVHYKNNANFNLRDATSKYGSYSDKYDSLTFFYLGEGCDLTVSNTTGDDAEVWYDGWMHNRTNFLGGPNYIYTAVRDVFRVEAGAELTVNNTDIKAGRNRKIWMVNSYYTDREGETNLLIKLTYNGYAYEQIYGSAIVANGGKVTVNGGYIEGRGGYRNFFNVSGVPEYNLDSITDVTLYGNFERNAMIENCLSNVGSKAAVQIAGEGSTVIINDGEFWGCGGADVIGINGLNGGSVNEYTLRINAGTFDTSKTDKERLPDRCAGVVNSGPWPWSHANWMLWANCRCIRDTLRGNIGIPAVDGYGENVFNTKMVHVYIDDEEPEDECIDNADLNFRNKSDSDTIIVKPREEKAYSFTDTHTWYDYNDRAHYKIYVYYEGKVVAGTASGGGTLYNGPESNQTLFFSAESHFDMTDADNPYFDRAHIVNCTWTLYEEDENGNLVNTYQRVTSPFKADHRIDEEHGDGHTVYNFKISMSSFTGFSDVTMDADHKYYIVANMEEFFHGKLGSDYYRPLSYMDNVFQDWTDGIYDGDGVLDFYYNMGLDIVYGQSLATCGAAVVYSNAVYDSDPVLTFNDAFNEMKVNGTEVYQWQVLEGDEWVDYGNYRYSPELAVEGLLKHRDLTGKQVRLKITPEYADELPIYSNACTVQKDQNTRWPTIGVFNWEADPDNDGRYITKSTSYNDALEWLIYPYDSDRDLSSLKWSNAVDVPEFNNLEIGVYTVYARFKETVDYEAGTEIGYSKVVVGNYVAPTGTNILYNGKPVTEIFVKQGETFDLTVGPVPDNATLNSTNVTTWIPDTEKSNIIQYYTGRNGLYAPFNKSLTGRTIEFMGDTLGYVTFNAVTTLADGASSTETITVRVVPENYIPYTVSVVNRGSEVIEGGSFVPQVALHARLAMLTERRATKFEAEDLLNSEIKTQLQSDTIKKQLRERLTWALVNPIPQLGMSPFTESTAKASINTTTGKITLKDAAVAGNVINFVGLLNDPYLGQIIIPGSFTVVAAPEPEPHTCDYEGYAVIPGSLSAHYRVCECGKKKTETHSFKEFSTENADQTVIKYVCPCGVSYSETGAAPVAIHVHAIEYAYDNNEHWQICTDEDCPDEYVSEHQAHNYVLTTDDSGNEGYVCSTCKCVAADNLATLSGQVVSFGDENGDVTLQLIAVGQTEADYEVVVKGNSATYSIEGVAEGTYILRVMKVNHVTREYTVVIDNATVVQDVKIHLIGDINGDGNVNATDKKKIYAHINDSSKTLTGYEFLAADVNGDGSVNATDKKKVFAHVNGNPLW